MKRKREKKKPRHRRRARLKKRTGPVQLLLPLQMPLALGVPFVSKPGNGFHPVDDEATPAAPNPGEQRALFG